MHVGTGKTMHLRARAQAGSRLHSPTLTVSTSCFTDPPYRAILLLSYPPPYRTIPLLSH